MKVYTEIPAFPLLNDCVATIGNFDGLHLGHRKLINETKKKADQLNLPSVVITFDPHPVSLFAEKSLLPLTDMKKKLELIDAMNVDMVFVLPFTKEFAAQSALEFIESFLEKVIHCKLLCVGYDFRMGKDALCKEALKEALKKIHCEIEVVKEVTLMYGDFAYKVSSTFIREVLAEGNVELGAALLHRPYSVRGIVVHGAKRGSSLLGFPTANMDTGDLLLPKQGVYATSVFFPAENKNQKLPSISNIGYNPTFAGTKLVIETYILDFDKDIYGEELEVEFHKLIRNEKKFSSHTDLVAQLEADRTFRKQYKAL